MLRPYKLYISCSPHLNLCSDNTKAHTHTHTLLFCMCVRLSNSLLLAQSLCSEARGSAFSNTPIYFMTSLTAEKVQFQPFMAWGIPTWHRARWLQRGNTRAALNTLVFPSPNRQAGTFSHLCNSTTFLAR